MTVVSSEKGKVMSRYKVDSFFDIDERGLCYSNSSLTNWSQVEEIAHEWLSDGGVVRITDLETGNNMTLNPDMYFEMFNGEFPIKPDDLETPFDEERDF